MNIETVAFFDIETVAIEPSFETLQENNPRQAKLWEDWQNKYKEKNGDLTMNELWQQMAGLHAEYGKVVCASFGYYPPGIKEPKIISFYGDDEKEILEKCAKVLVNADNTGKILGGCNIERFDISFLWKRMLINDITPPSIISLWNKKPWDYKFFDIMKIFSGGSYKESFTSLDTMASLFDVESSKDKTSADKVFDIYWNQKDMERIRIYCEKDVAVTMSIAQKMVTTINGTSNHLQ